MLNDASPKKPYAVPLRALRGKLSFIRRRLQNIPERHANPYATNVPPLIALGRTMPIRKVVEFGCGLNSTLTFLDRTAFPDLVLLDVIENDAAWAAKVQVAASNDPRCRITYVTGQISEHIADVPLHEYDLVFVDDSATEVERAATIRAVSAAGLQSALVVLHDFEHVPYRQAATGFAHHFTFSTLNPYTGILWNAAQVDLGRLRRMRRTIARYSPWLPLDARAAWLQAFQNDL